MSEAIKAKKISNPYGAVANLADAPVGSKRTEVGIIPLDWNVVSLDTICSEIGDGIHATPIYAQQSDSYFINGNNIRNGRIVITSDTKSVDWSEFRKYKTNLNDRTVLLSINGTIGNVALFANERVVLGKSAAYLNVTTDVDRRYFFYSLQTASVAKQFDAGLTGTTIKNLGLGAIRDTQIPIPPTLEEQCAIAEALSDVEELLGSLEALIAKKRAIKQATMQQLLTGKTRLPGFRRSNGWKPSEVGQIPKDWRSASIPQVLRGSDGLKIGPFGSSLKKEHLSKVGYKVYGQENVFEKNMNLGDRYIDAKRFSELRSCEVRPGDFLISMMGTIGKCMVASIVFEPGIMDSHLLRLRLDPRQICARYLLQLFATNRILDQVRRLSVGGIMEGLSSSIVKRISLPLPEIDEQEAIATVLSDMDTEIAALEAHRDKTRAIKQGMMQQLLTGRIRLVEPQQAEKNA